MVPKIRLGMSQAELIKALASGDVSEVVSDTYTGSIRIKGFMPISTPHSVNFEDPNDGSKWTLEKVVIKEIKDLRIDNKQIAKENYYLYPLISIIDNKEQYIFHISSGSIVGSNFDYNIICECTMAMEIGSYREVVKKINKRIDTLETNAGGSVDEDKVVEIVDQHIRYLQIPENITKLQDNVGEHENRLDEQHARLLAIEIEDLANKGYVDQEIRYSIVEEAHSGLETTNKTIVGAINEINAKEVSGGGLVIGETTGTAYDGGKGFAVANDVAQLKIDVNNLADGLEEAVGTVNPVLENHETRILTLEQSGGGGSSSGGGLTKADVEAMFVGYEDVTQKTAFGRGVEAMFDPWDYEQDTESAFSMAVTAIAGPLASSEAWNVVSDYMSMYGSLSVQDSYDWETGNTIGKEIYNGTDPIWLESVIYRFSSEKDRNITLGETLDDFDSRITVLENGGGSSGGSGGSEPSGGTKLYKITGNAFENLDGTVTFDFQAVVSKDPTLLAVFDEIFDNFGMVSITLMPDDSGFYPIGVVKKNNSWKVYGFKEGNMTTSDANFLINFKIEEL